MFSIGFFELLLVGIVGLLVLGPDRLPGAVREATLWINRFRRYAREVQRDFEAQVEDIDNQAEFTRMSDGRKLFDEMQRDLNKAIGTDSSTSAADAPKTDSVSS